MFLIVFFTLRIRYLIRKACMMTLGGEKRETDSLSAKRCFDWLIQQWDPVGFDPSKLVKQIENFHSAAKSLQCHQSIPPSIFYFVACASRMCEFKRHDDTSVVQTCKHTKTVAIKMSFTHPVALPHAFGFLYKETILTSELHMNKLDSTNERLRAWHRWPTSPILPVDELDILLTTCRLSINESIN